jgi:pyochelin biosynthesis protein PchC
MKPLLTLAEGAVRFSIAGAAPVRRQLVVFPHAGGSAEYYRPWRARLPAEVDLIVLQYPGPTAQEAFPGWPTPDAALRRCLRGLGSLLGLAPATFFGHSMGALLALHVAAALLPSRFTVAQLVLSSQLTPPTLREIYRTPQDLDQLADRALDLGEAGAHQRLGVEARALVAATIRRDLDLLLALAALPVGALPATRVFGGQDDPLVSPARLAEWQAFLPRGAHAETFPGGHFYHRDALDPVLDAILRPDAVAHAA